MRRTLALGCLAFIAGVGCSFLVDTRGRCGSNADCLGSQHCAGGFCVEGAVGGGSGEDAGSDAGEDAGVVDAGGSDAGTDAGSDAGTDAGCVAETNTQFCQRQLATCDSVNAPDNCGTARTVNCGTCGCGHVCSNHACVVQCSMNIGQACGCQEECCGGSAQCVGNVCCKGNGVTAGCGPNPVDTPCVCDSCCSGCSKNNQCVNSSQCNGSSPACTP
ncbi:MAG: hypothetical protein U0228_38865 [Myxococcaceae bacterium]